MKPLLLAMLLLALGCGSQTTPCDQLGHDLCSEAISCGSISSQDFTTDNRSRHYADSAECMRSLAGSCASSGVAVAPCSSAVESAVCMNRALVVPDACAAMFR